jgi:hypothetical protein
MPGAATAAILQAATRAMHKKQPKSNKQQQ